MTKPSGKYDVIIIGAGAAGLMAAVQAGLRGKKTLLIEHTNKIGEKIRISGGGRCNFTNLYASPQNFISQNPHFMKSAFISIEVFNLLQINNTVSYTWVTDVTGRQYAIPNYLTRRQLNVKLQVRF